MYAHALYLTAVGNVCLQQASQLVWRRVDNRAVQLFAPINHIEKGSNLMVSSCSCLKNLSTCLKVRSDKVVGIVGSNNASAATNTFSEVSEILGGQSRNT